MLFPKVKLFTHPSKMVTFSFFTVLKFLRLQWWALREVDRFTGPGRRKERVSTRSTRQRTGLKR